MFGICTWYLTHEFYVISTIFISFDKHAFLHASVTFVYYAKQSNIKLKYPLQNNTSQYIPPFQNSRWSCFWKKLFSLNHTTTQKQHFHAGCQNRCFSADGKAKQLRKDLFSNLIVLVWTRPEASKTQTHCGFLVTGRAAPLTSWRQIRAERRVWPSERLAQTPDPAGVHSAHWEVCHSPPSPSYRSQTLHLATGKEA